MAAIIQPSKLYFWPENQPENLQIFDLLGCEENGGMNTTGLDMILTNRKQKRVEMRFFNHHQTEQWVLAMIATIQEINQIKMAGPLAALPTILSESEVDDPSAYEQEKPKAINQSNDDADFGLTFTVPRICLNLKTPKKLISNKISSSDSNEWEIKTVLEQIAFEMEQRSDELSMKANVSQLKVADNTDDERFPFIF